jgi:peptide deformylase
VLASCLILLIIILVCTNMIKNAVQIGSRIVRNKSKSVEDFKNAKKLVNDLTDSMRHYGLVGMAAPQIGINLRVFVSEIRKTKTRKLQVLDSLRVFINPKIIDRSKKQTILYEGCGSLAYGEIFGPVKRPAEVTIEAYDLQGKKFILKAKNLLAKVIQHEIDHLDGIICIDRFIDTKKVMHREEYLKASNLKKKQFKR